MMSFFYWLALLIVVVLALFSIQNSTAPPVVVKFLFWQFETSLIYALMGSVGLGILLALFFSMPRAIRSSVRMRDLRRQKENLEAASQSRGSSPREGEPPSDR